MANPVSTAIGTQRQFAKQPERVYQANLKNPSFSRGISVSADEGAKLLARSLGVLGDAIVRESIASDNRKKELGTAEAERRFEVTSEEDKHKLAALDILGRNSDFDMSDNPYAVARVEELRGQYLSKQYKNRYETEVLPTQELAPNSQANAKQFEDFMKACLEEDNVKITNNVAFSEGFYGNRPNDLLEIDAKYRQRKQADLIADRNAGITSKMDSILSASINTPPEELAGLMQDLQVDGAITNLSLSERVKLFSEAGKQIAGNGNPEQLKAWGETVAWFDSNTGKEKRIKDILPMGEFMTMSAKANVAMNEAATRDFFKSIEDVPSAALEEHFEKLKIDNPYLYKAVAGKYDELYAKKQKEEAKAIKEASTAMTENYKQNTAFAMLDDRFAVLSKGGSFDTAGYSVASNKFAFNGKEYSFDERTVIAWCNLQFAKNQEIPDWKERTTANMSVLKMKAAAPYAKALETQMTNSLSLLNLNSLSISADGSATLPEGLEKGLNLYQLSPSEFSNIFSEAVTDKMRTLSTLIDANGIEKGVTKYAELQTALNDKDTKELLNKDYKDLEETLVSIPDVPMLGDNSKDNINLQGNFCLVDAFKHSYLSYRAAGVDNDTAEAMAKEDMSKIFFNYEGYAIPQAFIRNIPSSNQKGACFSFLTAKCKELCNNGDPNDVSIIYIPGTRQIKCSYRASTYVADIFKFTEDVRKYLETIPAEQRVTLEDIYGDVEENVLDKFGGIYE